MDLPSGDHSYMVTPVAAAVPKVIVSVSGSIAATCGPLAPATSTEIALPSGRHRRRGAGSAGVKMRCEAASRFGVPPADGITNSAVSCALRVTDGVDTV